MWSPPFLWPGQRIQQYNISVINNERVEHHMLDSSLTNPIITVSFPTNPSLMQFNTQNMLACMPTMIMFSISPVYDGSVLEPIQTFNISDWVWTFPSGKCSLQWSKFSYLLITLYHNYDLSFSSPVYADIGSEFTVPAINTSVLFKADGAPALLKVYIQVYNQH